MFLVDLSQSDPTGLTTYVVTSNHEIDINTGQRHYRIYPLPSGPFRAAEYRLVEVGYCLGAEVIKPPFDALPSIVIKRYVREGLRFYDLKDAAGVTTQNVAEWELQPHTGGEFPFVNEGVL